MKSSDDLGERLPFAEQTNVGLEQEVMRLRDERDALLNELKDYQFQISFIDAIETISEAIVIYDADGRLVACNQKFCDLYGYSKTETMPGVHFSELGRIDIARGNVSIGDEAGGGMAYLERKAKYRKNLEGSFNVNMSDGRWIKTTDRPTSDGGFVSVQVDITETKKKEADLARALDSAEQAVRIKSEFLANMSHDLRTPLNAIIGFSELMKRELFGPISNPRYEEYLLSIHSSGNQLLALVNDILDVSKLENGIQLLYYESFDAGEYTTDILRNFDPVKNENNIQIDVSLSDDFPGTIIFDKKMFAQILNNLVSNACKHTKLGDTVNVHWMISGSNEICVKVSDTGEGIPETLLAKLGQPFVSGEPYTAKESGQQSTGLGLYICKKLLEKIRGRVVIESELGVGTSVSAIWPIIQAEEEAR